MPYISAWFHLVWSTKMRRPYLSKQIRTQLFDHILKNAKLKGIFIDCINGHFDHMHCLISLSADQTLSKTVQMIKGESSWWINNNKLSPVKFEWQSEYFAISISQPDLKRVREYIYNQETHHRQQTFEEEYKEFLKEYFQVE